VVAPNRKPHKLAALVDIGLARVHQSINDGDFLAPRLWSSGSEGQRMVTRFLLSEFGVSFATRGRGEELRKQALKRAGASSTLIVDFAGVQRVSYAFADEFVGKLVAEGGDLTVEVAHASGIVGRTVEGAVRRRTASAAS
jgi:hypothetical protein